MKINSTTAYIVNKNTVKQLIDELLKSGYTLYDSSHSKLSLAEIENDVIKNDGRVDEVVIYNPKVIL